MEIANRQIKVFKIIHYNDECIKTIQIYEFYMGNTKTPEYRLKIVRFRFPNGTIDKKRSYISDLIIDESKEFDTEYTNLDVQMLTTINYNDGCSKTIEIHEVYTGNMKTPVLRYKIVRFILPNGTFDKKRSYFNSLNDNIEEFETA